MLEIYDISQISHKEIQAHSQEGLLRIMQNISKESPLPLPKINHLLLLSNCNGQWCAVACIKISLHKNALLHLSQGYASKTCDWLSECSWAWRLCTFKEFSQNADSASPHTTPGLGNMISIFFLELSARCDTSLLCTPRTFLLNHILSGTIIFWYLLTPLLNSEFFEGRVSPALHSS